MGTVFSFAYEASLDRRLLRAVEDELDRVDRVFSPFRADSETSRLARCGVPRRCSADMAEVLDRCAEARTRTDGYFDAAHSGRLDPTGVVKGWAVDRAVQMLSAGGSTRHAVNGGGDILAVADPDRDEPWRVGVSGGRAGNLVAVLRAHNLAVATSGNTERPGEIVNPRTGRPGLAITTATVTGPDIVLADAAATAAVAHGAAAPGWMTRLPGYRLFVVTADGRLTITPNGQESWSSAACSERT
jgi:thiamine biosynthesis lipoprotein